MAPFESLVKTKDKFVLHPYLRGNTFTFGFPPIYFTSPQKGSIMEYACEPNENVDISFIY